MLIKSKIVNITEVAKYYLKNLKGIIDPTQKLIEDVTNADFSCKLCLRFLNNPITHQNCNSHFCRECKLSWVTEFGFCIECKADFSEEEVRAQTINLEMMKIIQMIRLECNFGNCAYEVALSSRGTSQDLQVSLQKTNRFMKNALNFPKKKKWTAHLLGSDFRIFIEL